MFTLFAFLAWIGSSPIPYIADILGSSEQALNLLLSILLSYPLAIVYHKYVRKHVQWRNLFFILTGLDMAFFNFGLTLYHNAIPVLVLYISTMFLGAGKINTLLTIVFNMSYLVAGYIFTESENYDITWTMPHCVLTLKIIALSFDLWDGAKIKNGKQVSENQLKTAIIEKPSLEELLGFIYFTPCFLVGPIFSFKRYKDYITGVFPLDDDVAQQIRVKDSMKTLGLGLLYLLAHQVGGSIFNVDYMLSDEFSSSTNIFYRHFYCGIWAHFALCKYISCWLLTEGACILFGLSYNGVVEKDKVIHKWDGCRNIKLVRFEMATKFQHYIDSFNCNTNFFAAEYIYKRLRFLGNRNASQCITLFFLALWHGVNTGYYVTFLNEFLIILMEKEFESIISRTSLYQKLWSTPGASYFLYFLLKCYTIVFMGWSLVPFDLKLTAKWYTVYMRLWFSGFVLFAPWICLYKPLLIKSLKKFNRT